MPEVVSCLQANMCSRLGGASRLTIQVASLALLEGHPMHKCHPSRLHMCTRMHVATEKGLFEAIDKLAIIAPFAYMLPTH